MTAVWLLSDPMKPELSNLLQASAVMSPAHQGAVKVAVVVGPQTYVSSLSPDGRGCPPASKSACPVLFD